MTPHPEPGCTQRASHDPTISHQHVKIIRDKEFRQGNSSSCALQGRLIIIVCVPESWHSATRLFGVRSKVKNRVSLYLEHRFRRHVYEERLLDSTAANRLRKVDKCTSYKHGNRDFNGDKLARDRRE